MFDLLRRKLSERSTYAGALALVAAVTGRVIAPELADAITEAGLALAGLALIVVREHKA